MARARVGGVNIASSTDKRGKLLDNAQDVYLMLIATICRRGKGVIFYLMDDKGFHATIALGHLNPTNDSSTKWNA